VYYAHEKNNAQTNQKSCYHIVVKSEVEQSSHNFDIRDCNAVGFKKQVSVGRYRETMSEYEGLYADGDMKWCEKKRKGFLIVEEDPSVIDPLVDASEPMQCEYHFKLTVPSCSVPVPPPPSSAQHHPQDCKVSEIIGKEFYIFEDENQQTGKGYCYKLVVQGTIEQSDHTFAQKDCNAQNYKKRLTVGHYSKDISDVEELYDEGDDTWCGRTHTVVNSRRVTSKTKRKGYLIVQEDPSVTAVALEMSEPSTCEYHFRITVPSCSA
jgi:hypothetical protein